MNRRVFVTLVALVVAYLAGGSVAYAQKISADVAFPFVAAGKDVAAGMYSVEVTAAGPLVLTGQSGLRIVLPIITSLARHAQDQESGFVFDKDSGKSVLSEVWMPGKDGMLVVATTKAHEHAVVPAAAPKK
ncbi:MAG: hypothetical protein NTY02_03630 [Acidobacteria bacterium]|nr:hypothetical protein [Acidobacteriota bacterium]